MSPVHGMLPLPEQLLPGLGCCQYLSSGTAAMQGIRSYGDVPSPGFGNSGLNRLPTRTCHSKSSRNAMRSGHELTRVTCTAWRSGEF